MDTLIDMTRMSRKQACDGSAGISGAANKHAALGLDPAALYRLMAWLSPAYPTGAFSYSSGIEWAIEAGDINDAATLRAWLTVMIAEGSMFCDAAFFAHAFRAAAEGNAAALREVGYAGYLSAEVLPLPDPLAAARQTIETFRRYVG